ncbi:MAG: hypothetical protein WDA42_05340 [Candidatus Bathyarchaeia archaeon]
MPAKDLYASITGTTNIVGVDVTESFTDISTACNIQCTATDLNIGDDVSVDLGYSDDHGVIFTGIVKQKNREATSGIITLECYSTLVRATDFFIAAEDPENPFKRTNIDATELVEDLLSLAGITNFSGTLSNFIFTEPTFNLVSVADAISQINSVIAWRVWDDAAGVVHFEDRRPYVMDGETPSHTYTTGNDGNLLTLGYERSESELRNKVVVYGLDPIVATASAASPYLPAGFYKAAVVASPLIDSQEQAQLSANYNLNLYNRLTTNVDAETLGDYSLHVNDIVSVTESHTGVTGNWLVYKVSHAWGEDGYTTRMVLKQ